MELLGDAIGALPSRVLRAFNFLAALARQDADEPARVRLPARGFHDLGQSRTLTRFIIARTSAFLLLRASVARFCVPARRALPAFLGSAAFVPFLALGAPFVLVASLFEGAFSGATCAPCSATVAALSLVSAFVMLLILFCALRA